MSKLSLIIIILVIALFVGAALIIPRPEPVLIGQIQESEGQQHLSTIDQDHVPYKTNPPTSGAHFVQPAAWGVSDVEIPDEQLLHNLEHGGVVITYDPDMSQEDIERVISIGSTLTATDDQKDNKGFKVIVAPRVANDGKIQLSAWRYSLVLDSVDAAKMQQFYRDQPNLAPEANAL